MATKSALLLGALFLGACGRDRPNSDNTWLQPGEPPGACRVIQPDQPGGGRRVLMRCSGEKVLASHQGYGVRNHAVRVNFAPGGEVLLAEQVARIKGSGNDMSDDIACQQMFLKTLKQLQNIAKKHGGSGVSHVRSYLEQQDNVPAGEFDCLVGTMRAHVTLIGDVVR